MTSKRYSHLPALVYTEVIDLPVVLCPDKVQRAVIAERAPLGVDQDVLLVWVLVAVEHFAVLDLLDVARVAAGAF